MAVRRNKPIGANSFLRNVDELEIVNNTGGYEHTYKMAWNNSAAQFEVDMTVVPAVSATSIKHTGLFYNLIEAHDDTIAGAAATSTDTINGWSGYMTSDGNWASAWGWSHGAQWHMGSEVIDGAFQFYVTKTSQYGYKYPLCLRPSIDAVLIHDDFSLRIGDNSGSANTDPSSYVDFSHDGTDLNVAGTSTTDINLTGARLDVAEPVATAKYFQFRTETATNIADVTHAVNTDAGKVQGAAIWDSTNDKMKIATGAADASTWVDADGTNAVTPA